MVQINELNDNQLVDRFKSGCQEAMEELVVRNKNRVYTYIFLIVKKQDVAEDIFQETFIKVIKSLKNGKYIENGKFVSWVLRIAHNLIIDHYRKIKSLNTFSKEDRDVDVLNSLQHSDSPVENSIIQDQVLKQVGELVHLLPDEQKEVVIMRYYWGLSFKEIADQTEVSINTALGRMRYALINLRKIVEDKKISLVI